MSSLQAPALAAIGLAAIGLATIGLAAIGLAALALGAQPQPQPAQRTRMAFDKPLPAMDGAHLTMKVVDVRYGPGESSTPHRHNCAVVVFVISGTVRMQVRGGPDSVYKAGESFHETPTDIHQVSANASKADSAHFTATFVCEHQGPLSVPAPGAH